MLIEIVFINVSVLQRSTIKMGSTISLLGS